MKNTVINRREFQGLVISGTAALLGGRFLRGEEAAPPDTTPIAPLPFVEGSSTLVILPDTQLYAECYPKHFYRQTEWIRSNKKARDIRFVAHLGDITNNNTPREWKVAQRAMRTLDGVVPYSLVLGNHDYEGNDGDASTRNTLLNEYFPLDQQRHSPAFGGVMKKGCLDNSYHKFQLGPHKILLLALEWGPRDAVIDWANEIVAENLHHCVVLTTHAYLYSDDTRYDWTKYGKKQMYNPKSYPTSNLPGGVNDGQKLWEKLAARHKGMMMTINGHVTNDGQGYLASTATAGNRVHQLLTNYQMLDEGGLGYLRLIELLPDGQTLQMKTYSPSSRQYKTDPQNQFVVKLDTYNDHCTKI